MCHALLPSRHYTLIYDVLSSNNPNRWAWQNTHITRHIASDDRINRTSKKQQTAAAIARASPKSSRRRRPPRPRLCLTDRLANLHLLLRARSFERWPLKVTFYAEDVYRVWTR